MAFFGASTSSQGQAGPSCSRFTTDSITVTQFSMTRRGAVESPVTPEDIERLPQIKSVSRSSVSMIRGRSIILLLMATVVAVGTGFLLWTPEEKVQDLEHLQIPDVLGVWMELALVINNSGGLIVYLASSGMFRNAFRRLVWRVLAPILPLHRETRGIPSMRVNDDTFIDSTGDKCDNFEDLEMVSTG